MSQALPGEHLCLPHQGNGSHYAPENCTICKLQARLDAAIDWMLDDCNNEWTRHDMEEHLTSLVRLRGL